jgi:hypothetical protein
MWGDALGAIKVAAYVVLILAIAIGAIEIISRFV